MRLNFLHCSDVTKKLSLGMSSHLPIAYRFVVEILLEWINTFKTLSKWKMEYVYWNFFPSPTLLNCKYMFTGLQLMPCNRLGNYIHICCSCFCFCWTSLCWTYLAQMLALMLSSLKGWWQVKILSSFRIKVVHSTIYLVQHIVVHGFYPTSLFLLAK